MPCTITHPDAVSPEWLTKILHQDGCLQQGKVVSISITSEPTYTSTVARLKVTYSDNATPSAPSRLFLKLSRLDSKQRVVGSEQRRNEVLFHNEVAAHMIRPPLVSCYNAVYCDEIGSSQLLFDDVSESHFAVESSKPPPVHFTGKAMDAFAEFHAYWWDHQALGDFATLPSQVSVDKYISSIGEHFPQFSESLGDQQSDLLCQVYEKTLSALPILWKRVLQGKNLTLIHGDANFSNVLLPRHPDKEKALIIDWQLWGISFATEDLAHMIALYCDIEYRHRMEKSLVMRYHQGLVHHGVKNYSWLECWNDYRLAVILRVLFMPLWFWLSGSPISWWQRSLDHAMQAFEDLNCLELVESC